MNDILEFESEMLNHKSDENWILSLNLKQEHQDMDCTTTDMLLLELSFAFVFLVTKKDVSF